MSGEEVKRRLAAVLAADVVGYSRLMEQDEAGTLARLRSHRRELIDPTIAEHKGRIVKTTGDGILAEFTSVVEAVACALAVQRDMAQRNAHTPPDARIEFRVGINQGDIIVEEDDIFGDGVNVAARLEGLAEAGGICVSARVHEDAAGRLDLAFDDLGEQHLRNISRPIRVYRVRAVGPATITALAQRTPTLSLPDKPSIAVLPFANMSNDPDQEFFADGIAEDIITALSRNNSLFVIARNSCLTYKARAVDVKQVGQELGVRYILEGSLRKAGSRIRVTAQLVEGETGNHVWAERYDRELADIFDVQDEITTAVTVAIAPAIADAEQKRAIRKLPAELDAWGAYQRGLWHLSKASREDNELSQKFFRQAIDIDPGFGGGYRGLASAQFLAAAAFQMQNLAEAGKSVEVLARRAIALDSADAEAHTSLGLGMVLRGDHSGALAEFKRALAISPNLAMAHGHRGMSLVFSGRPEEGLRDLHTSIRLDPRDPFVVVRLMHVASALYFLRQYEDAVEAAEQAVRSFPDFPLTYRWLAAALGQSGQIAAANAALLNAMAIYPPSFEMYVRGRVPWMRPEDQAHILDGLRQAGWKG